ncbi:LuxR family transcriptional regulator [Amycolatopsis sp. WAC 01375]|uniref:helix-turn-helix transcriptional regulator n=1 Tax=Amycolatopsis sp. WAC 01375 TaxID=2203194 RepID=UPI000F78C8CB|nr:LuxR family transcriptional regulator [Amycolatopsis sp. WAC 01375]RSM83397.1 LuxR family transcriptional regulator [Amycolatopsis sp. WAC 01375]
MWLATPRPTSVSVRAGSTALVGRDVEVSAIVKILLRRPAAVLIEGEPGMGRSRLLEELAGRREFTSGRVLSGACQPMREPFPFGPLLEALRSVGDRPLGPLSPVAGVLRPLLPELAESLPPRPEPLADPCAERHRQFRAVRELLIACGPALVLIDDLQWADEDTRDLMRFLTAAMPAELAVVAAYRTGSPSGHGAGIPFRTRANVQTARVTLGPLDVEAVGKLAEELLDLPRVSAPFTAKLHESTAGIPFVVEETLRALRDAAGRLPIGEVLSDRLLESLEVPISLREAITERLDALPEPAVRLACAAAVLAVPSEPAVIGELACLDGDGLRSALLSTLDGGVLGELGGDRYGFRHPLARKAVYDTISGPERTLLHSRAIQVLAGQPVPPLTLLANHSRAAGRTEQWRHYAEAAADEAIARGDTSRAIDLLQSVLAEASLGEDDIARLATKLSQVALRGFRPDVIETLERILEDLTDLRPSVRGTIRLSLGMLLVRTIGRLGRGRVEVEKAITELVDEPELAARGINLLAQPIDGLTPLSWHEVWMNRAREVFDRIEDPELRLALLGDRISTQAHIGDGSAWTEFTELPDHGGVVDGVAERVQLARLWCNLADAQSWAGHLARAEKLVTEGIRRATDAGALYAAGLAQGTRVRLDWVRGDWSGLAETTEQLRDTYPDLGPIVMECSLVLGGLAAVRGEFAAAQRHLTAASVHAPEHGPIPVVLSAAGVLIRVLLATDDVDGACAAADNAVTAARRKGVWVWAAALVPASAEAYTRAGRWSEADAVVEEFARGIDGKDSPVSRVALLAGQAILLDARGKHPAAATVFDEAATGYEALPMPYQAICARERAALCRLNAGRLTAGRLTAGQPTAGDRKAIEELTAAAEAYERLGATRDAGRCRHQLREHGAWAPSQRGRRGYGQELSPRELEVARMLSDGRTNREIADGLFLSPRTVEQHVAKVLRKLGARSRTDVARRMTTYAPATADR